MQLYLEYPTKLCIGILTNKDKKTILKAQDSDLKWGQKRDEDNRTNFYHMFSKNSCHIQMAEQ